ncbi:LPS export ABC transporter periplasmic protein LptC [Pontibacter sp. KCTC 32443]|uniref:OstA-like protein n=1 Tax=Pontibacter TaxID=323449 RepID=UPI00164E689B|nr:MULTISPECIES: OstA-like protein [Pontibacter]MBC5775432.1 LPS export ABC transporter periplasmic protein LptC [Pontibacter sp. KCTC 32443]
MKYTKLLFSIVFTLISLAVFGQQQLRRQPGRPPQVKQQPVPQQTRPKQEQPRQQQSGRVELIGADSLKGGTFNGRRIDKLLGNVRFKQRDTFLYADSVYQYGDNKDILEAFGNVRINQGDTLTITGDRATYDGIKRTARMSGNVTMQDPRMNLTTPSLDYDLNTKTATYTEGGTIVDPENRLESRKGSYNTNTKEFTFQQNVKVTTADYNITAQNMRYNTQSKVVYFAGPTVIKGEKGDLYAEQGTYNTISKISNFGKNAYILTPEYRLGGDELYYDQNTGYGVARKNVSLRSLKDDVTVRGQLGRYWRDRGIAKVSGSPVMESIMKDDTLYLSADSLISKEAQGATGKSMLFAFNNVKIFKSDLQGKCDSLSFNRTDSVMHMNVKPVLWSEKNQLVSDTIHVYLRNKTIDRMYMYSNAFMSSEDTLSNYNQVKGRNMIAYFTNGDLKRLNVNGNGESLYFALEGDTTVTGMNKAICSNMVLQFAENKLNKISFLVNPDANFIPPHELKPTDKQLEGFTWLEELRPSKPQVFAKRAAVAPKKTTPKKAAKPKQQTGTQQKKRDTPAKNQTSNRRGGLMRNQ